jgi:hypothetical protein
MSMNNPLADNAPTDHEDQALVMRTRSGDREALEHLIERHQGWIYNIAVRMLYHPQDAEDATQEILVKVLTRLFVRGAKQLPHLALAGRVQSLAQREAWARRAENNDLFSLRRCAREHA